MDITDLVKRAAVKKSLRRYEGDDEHSVSFRVPTDMFMDIDSIADYLGLSRAQTMRALLREKLPSLVELCESQGPNADGHDLMYYRRQIHFATPAEQAIMDQYEEDEAHARLGM